MAVSSAVAVASSQAIVEASLHEAALLLVNSIYSVASHPPHRVHDNLTLGLAHSRPALQGCLEDADGLPLVAVGAALKPLLERALVRWTSLEGCDGSMKRRPNRLVLVLHLEERGNARRTSIQFRKFE